GRNFSERGELNPSRGLSMLSDPFEDVLRVFKQRAFEERESARLLERDNDRHVLLLESEAGLAPLQCFGKVAVDSDLTQLICFLLPLFRIGTLHLFSLPQLPKIVSAASSDSASTPRFSQHTHGLSSIGDNRPSHSLAGLRQVRRKNFGTG